MYWRNLVVQLVGYEAQYQMFLYLKDSHQKDFLDTAASNVVGAAASVVIASILTVAANEVNYYYNIRLLRTGPTRRSDVAQSSFGNFMFKAVAVWVRIVNKIGIGKRSDRVALDMEKKLHQHAQELHDRNHSRSEIILTAEEEAVLIEAIVDSGDLSVWSLLMPAVYQLVPGSLIARLWYAVIFPPAPLEEIRAVTGSTSFTYKDIFPNGAGDEVTYGLWVVSTSLALGLLIGALFVHSLLWIYKKVRRPIAIIDSEATDEELIREHRREARHQGFLPVDDSENDPDGADGDKKHITNERRPSLNHQITMTKKAIQEMIDLGEIKAPAAKPTMPSLSGDPVLEV